MMRRILFVDMDRFFPSVERTMDSGLAGRPLIIGKEGGGRGVVIACSREAGAYGIHPFMRFSAAKARCPDGVFLPPNYDAYEAHSRRIHTLLTDAAPIVERRTIDDFYLDLTGCESIFGDIFRWSGKLKHTLHGETGLPLSIGMGTNKLVACIANRLSKADGLLQVLPGLEGDFLAPLPVGYLPGAQGDVRWRLFEMGVRRVGTLAAVPLPHLVKAFGGKGKVLHEEAHGRCTSPVVPRRMFLRIQEEIVFEADTADPLTCSAAVCRLSERLCRELRKARRTASRLKVTIDYTDGLRKSLGAKCAPTDRDELIYDAAFRLFRSLYTRRVRVRTIRLALFARHEPDRQETIPGFTRLKGFPLRELDRIRERFGFEAIGIARGFLGR
jgi:DNA polymerase-4